MSSFVILFIFLSSSMFADTAEEIRSHSLRIPNAIGNFDIEIEQHAIPKNLLATAVRAVLQREKTESLTISYDGVSEAVARDLKNYADELKISNRLLEEKTLNQILPPEVDAIT